MTSNIQLTYHGYCQLVSRIEQLTDSEKSLHTYIAEHFGELPYHGIVDLATNADVSKATIGRFLNKLGFTGYAAFKSALKDGLKDNQMSAPIDIYHEERERKPQDTPPLVHEFSSQIQQLINKFTNSINIDCLDKAIDLFMDTERKIYVVGPSSSAAMAMHFSTLIKYMRGDVALLNLDIGELPKRLIDVKKDDVLVVFSYYRFNSVAYDIARWFKKKHASVVLITNASSNPYGKYSDLQFVLPSETQTIFQSRMAGFMFVELILHLSYEKSAGEGNFAILEELFQFFGTFSAD
ncbi:MurR/RpiR family transcriptional regulator [Vibrio rumoiensis]|uniref:MurR/RpiR family transcriptional regulator n=1 Tax=Vibrio rumoiensis TaxID=76258 RepID=UPI000B5D049D|nr:MurR/RpiR family transcriptional regulator [Vibrio rumoiensis]